MAIGRGGFRCFKSAFERLCILPHNQQKEVGRHLTSSLSSFDIGKAALIATASRTPGRISRYAALKGSPSLIFGFVYSEQADLYHNLRLASCFVRSCRPCPLNSDLSLAQTMPLANHLVALGDALRFRSLPWLRRPSLRHIGSPRCRCRGGGAGVILSRRSWCLAF
jgi:hypothetical protein